MEAIAAALSLGIKAIGIKVIVPHHDLAFLMYYLRCVTLDLGNDILDDDLVDYTHYWRLSNERRALVVQCAQKFNPQELIDKVLFLDDEGVITRTFKNEFCDISVACSVVSVQRDVVIAGKMQAVSKVMFFKQSWLDEHYKRPFEHAVAQKWHLNPYFRAVTLFLAPLLSFTAFVLSIFTYLSPAVMFHDLVALVAVTPSAASAAQSGVVDGMRFFLGALGSCSKENNTALMQCTSPKFHPVYDLSVLPSSAPKLSIPSRVASTAPFIAISLGFLALFFILYLLNAFSGRMGKSGRSYDGRGTQKLTIWLAIIGCIIGLPSISSLRTLLWKSAQSFNDATQDPQYGGPQLDAHVANGFIMFWIAYGSFAPAFVISLIKLATQGKGSFWRI